MSRKLSILQRYIIIFLIFFIGVCLSIFKKLNFAAKILLDVLNYLAVLLFKKLLNFKSPRFLTEGYHLNFFNGFYSPFSKTIKSVYKLL